MSHEATNWAIKQRGLKPTTKIVLWHLCDRFNPDYGCFPSQVRLADDCEISRSTLNEHLGQLEATGLLRRVPRIDPVTKRQMQTRYILGFEPGFTPADVAPCPETGHGNAPIGFDAEMAARIDPDVPISGEPCPEFGHGIEAEAVSGFRPDPCPENGQSRVRNPDTNLVREPLRKPVKEEEEDAQARDSSFEIFFTELLGALGFAADASLPAWWQGEPARLHVRRWSEDLGLSEDRIIQIAAETRHNHPAPPDGPKALDRFMERAAQRDARMAATGPTQKAKRSRKAQGQPPPSPDELAAFYAAKINSDEYLPASMISNAMCEAMLTRGLVTAERLRARGVL
jgi:hypothetical protein